MRRIDFGVFEPADRTPYGSLDGERRRGNEIGDLVSLATFLGPELHRPGGRQGAAGVMKQWATAMRRFSRKPRRSLTVSITRRRPRSSTTLTTSRLPDEPDQ
jgi:hypothetical protein